MARWTLAATAAGLLLGGCRASEVPTAAWQPGTVYASPSAPNARGLLDRRGLIHAHSVYSHDACDNAPVKDGVRDEQCFQDFRSGVCATGHDFVMLTDHPASFADTEFPQALLHRPEAGDKKIERNGALVASRLACPDGHEVLVLAGYEGASMTVGLERHVAETPEARRAVYGSTSQEALATVADAGAVRLLQHTEDWTVEQLAGLDVDGFEMFNLHANALRSAGNVLELVVLATERPEELPLSDLILLPMWSEDPRYLERWGSVLTSGERRVTTMGTDCHRNSFPAIMPDGERGDSYRRMMLWLSNHLLVRPEADGSYDDRHLKDALRQGRLYGVVEVLGSPVGFDFVAETSDEVVEMGAEVSFTKTPHLKVRAPSVRDLDPAREAPEIEVRLLRAVEGGFEVVATSEGDLQHTPTRPGAYRAEVRMVPRHLSEDLGKYRLAELGDFVWIYANPIYVR